MNDIGVGTARLPPGLSFPRGEVTPQATFSPLRCVAWTPR